MATVYGVNKTKARTPIPANRIAKGLVDGRVKAMVDWYEASALAAGSIIELGDKLPKGARVVEAILHTDDLGNNTTIKVGDYEDDDRYITATDHGAGAELITRLNAIAGRVYNIDETTPSTSDRQIIATTGVGEATGTILLIVLYVQD